MNDRSFKLFYKKTFRLRYYLPVGSPTTALLQTD